jgi:hypothetical protein
MFAYVLLSNYTYAQQRNIWIFGDSTRLDFNQLSTPLRSNCWRSWASSTISDTTGNLIFYATYTLNNGFRESKVFNNNHQLMLNGDDIYCAHFANSNLIIPYPGNDSLFYLFCQESYPDMPTHPMGVYYNLVNPYKNSVGELLQKNIPLATGRLPTTQFSAIRHGNGRDWWLFYNFYYYENGSFYPSDSIFSRLITPSGISTEIFQTIGMPAVHFNIGQLRFSKTGNKACIVSGGGIIETFDFNRCTGQFSNPQILRPPNSLIGNLLPAFLSCEFSPNEQLLYVITIGVDTNYLYQLYLPNIDPWLNKTLIYTSAYPELLQSIEIGPNDLIYTAQVDNSDVTNDTLLTLANSTLGVIELPNFPGLSCLYNPYSQSLNGARSFGFLPNIPDYDLGSWESSICDSLTTGISSDNIPPPQLNIFPIPTSEQLNITLNNLSSNNLTITIYDYLGREIKTIYDGTTESKELHINASIDYLPSGIYLLQMKQNGVMTKKFVKL